MNENTIMLGTYKGMRSKAFPKQHYVLIKKAILVTLLMKQEMTLTELLAQATQQLNGTLRGDVHWYLLQVKMDLHIRQLIRISMEPGYTQVIKINPHSLRKVKSWLKNYDVIEQPN